MRSIDPFILCAAVCVAACVGDSGVVSGTADDAGGGDGSAAADSASDGGALSCKGDTAQACGASCTACSVPTGGRAVCETGTCRKVCDATATSELCAQNPDCVDTATSAANCGACGKSCEGGTCTAGRCDPATVVDGLTSPKDFAVGPTKLAISFDTKIQTCELPMGCSAANPLKGFASGFIQGGALFVYGPDVFFAATNNMIENPGLYTCPVATGCAGDISTLTFLDSHPGGITLATAKADRALFGWGDGRISTCLLSSSPPCSAPTSIRATAPVDEMPPMTALTTSTAAVFYDVKLKADANHFDRTCPLAGPCAAPTPFTNRNLGEYTFPTVALDHFQSSVFGGFGSTTPQIWSVLDTGTPAPTILANDDPGIADLVADANGVYWTNATKGTINHCPLAGCIGAVPEVLATGQTGATRIRLDATHVYWMRASSILRLVR